MVGFRNCANFLLSLTIVCLLFIFLPFTYEIFAKFAILLAVVRISEYLMTKTRRYIFYKRISNENKAVFITGCDSGFGHATAKRMDHLGYHVFAACLDPQGKGGTDLMNQCSSRLQVLPLDVTSDQSVQSAKDYVEKHLKNNVLWAVLNNAGVSQAGEIDWVPLDDIHKVYDINTMGILRVTKAFLPFLKKSKGRLINNTSICGEFICPGFVGYCMSKSAANAFTYGLRIEMMKWGVKVIGIQPFFYKTPLTCENSIERMIEETWLKVDPSSREDYGESYKEGLLKNTRKLLNRGSWRIHEVIDCFEDAVTAVEPLSTYTPAYFPHKFGIKMLKYLPSIVSEIYLKFELDQSNEPQILRQIKKGEKILLLLSFFKWIIDQPHLSSAVYVFCLTHGFATHVFRKDGLLC